MVGGSSSRSAASTPAANGVARSEHLLSTSQTGLRARWCALPSPTGRGRWGLQICRDRLGANDLGLGIR